MVFVHSADPAVPVPDQLISMLNDVLSEYDESHQTKCASPPGVYSFFTFSSELFMLFCIAVCIVKLCFGKNAITF